ncbi:MAG TPA: tRNA (N(6)-L-threonylcarbamoyladenosine(37)-C(2))-methylthiotransferase MtaB [Caldilineaceae bacterium]|nr:tRNA (N(6)-L-threonylcarbamoyladenosine(37)-C(2))-methylthiotransferase MtaB [Caldilineaceae bacterium]
MRVFLDQIGCRLNYSEMETLAQRLRAVGHQVVAAPEQAQVVVFNSCAVTAEASKTSRQRIRQLHRSNPQARLAVTGCWATLEPQAAAALPGVALVAENERKDLLHLLLEPWSTELDDPADLARMQPDGTPFMADEPAAYERAARTRAFVKVQDGCDNRCTFCVVTLARGQGRSRPLAAVVAEVQAQVAAGVQEVVLTGVHLGSYGRDLAGAERTDLKALVAALLAETSIPRLRLSSLEPWELAEGFFELWAKWPGRLCPHLHLPLQAGTDRQLRRMARRCTVESFRRLVAEARAAIPGLVVTTDLIVGFPGESEADFLEGAAFVEEMRFAHAHIFPFSPRAGTAAARFDGQAPAAVKKERARHLQAIVERTGRAERLRFIGDRRPVLWEWPRGEAQTVWTGFTDNYLRVMVEAPAHLPLHNTITPVRLDGLHGDTLLGTIVPPESASIEDGESNPHAFLPG